MSYAGVGDRKYCIFNVRDTTTSEEIDRQFASLYGSADDHSLVFVFNMERIRSMTLKKLMQIVPVVRKYREESERKLIETHVIIPEKWAYKILKCFIALPVVKTARPVKLHRDKTLLRVISEGGVALAH